MNGPTAKKRRPITRDLYAIMVALAAGRQTGAEIWSQIVGDTLGMNTALHRLVELERVEIQDKSYALTDVGWRALADETRTFELLVEQAKRRIVRGGYGRW